jgi:hypothetical protein
MNRYPRRDCGVAVLFLLSSSCGNPLEVAFKAAWITMANVLILNATFKDGGN